MFISEVHRFWIYNLRWWLLLSRIHSLDHSTIPLTVLLPKIFVSILAFSCGLDDASSDLQLGSYFAFCAICSSRVYSLVWFLSPVCARSVNLSSCICASKLNDSAAVASVSTSSILHLPLIHKNRIVRCKPPTALWEVPHLCKLPNCASKWCQETF